MPHAAKFLWIGLGLEIASVGITLVSAVAMQRGAEQERQVRFERVVDRAVVMATARMEQYATVLRAGVGLYDASKSVERDEWREFVEALDMSRRFPGSNGFGHISRVAPTELDRFCDSQRADGAPGFAVRTLTPPPPGDRYIIHFLEPTALNRPAIGLDLGSEPIRRQAVEAAMDSGEVRISRIITLVQDQQRKPGFVMMAPHYAAKSIPGTVEQRRATCIGWVYAPFVGERILRDLIATQEDGVAISIYDGVVDEGHRIADGGLGRVGAMTARREVRVGGQSWVFVASSLVDDAEPFGRTVMVLAAGLLTSTGLLVVLILLHRSSRQALDLAQAATHEAREAGEAKARFLAVMSHEIRTPLNGVIGMAELALQEDLPPTVRGQVQTMFASGQTLLALVNDILDFSRIDSGQLQLESLPFEVRHEIDTVVALLAGGAAARGLKLTVEGEAAAWVSGDALRLRQILMNLIGNAVKFTSHGGIRVRFETDPKGIRIRVSDTGIGMSAQQIERLFEPFTQADASTSRRFGGTGLGLSIVKRLTGLMGGTIRVDSHPGLGSTFTVQLPLPAVEPPVATTDTHRPAGTAAREPTTLGLHVLLAEDMPVNQLVASAMLKRLGCTVTVVADGAAAVAQAEGHAVILMDCQMPGMDGYEATRRLRAAGNRIPIIALTANTSDDDRRACREAGMDGFLSKPLEQDRLRAALLTAIGG